MRVRSKVGDTYHLRKFGKLNVGEEYSIDAADFNCELFEAVGAVEAVEEDKEPMRKRKHCVIE